MPENWITTTRILSELESSSDGEAWDMLFRHFNPVLVSFGRRLGLPPHDAEDAAQQTLLTFMRSFRSGKYNREKGHLSSWLLGIAGKVILSFRNRLAKERLRSDDGAYAWSWDQIPDENAVKHTWRTEWRRMTLQCALQQVCQEFKPSVIEAFELYALKNVPPAEVSTRLNMTVNAVYIAKTRVLSRLYDLLCDSKERI